MNTSSLGEHTLQRIQDDSNPAYNNPAGNDGIAYLDADWNLKNPSPAPLSVDGPTTLRDIDTSTIYAKRVAGKCTPGWVKTVNKKTQKVTWQWRNGNIGTKVVRKGVKVCKYTNSKGQTGTGTYNAAGVMTALPSNFPANPTVADIEALGLTKDTP